MQQCIEVKKLWPDAYEVSFDIRSYRIKVSERLWKWRPCGGIEWSQTNYISQQSIIGYLQELELRVFGEK